MNDWFKLPRFRKVSQKTFDMRTGILKKAVELSALSFLPYLWIGSGSLQSRAFGALGLILVAVRLVSYMFDHENDLVKPDNRSKGVNHE